MSYQHGIRVQERKANLAKPVIGTSGLQVIFGTAPVNLAKNPEESVNKLILVNSLEEAKQELGYSEDFKSYTLCQSMYACFKVFQVAPIILCNVLDPAVHKKAMAESEIPVSNKQAIIKEKGLLLSSLQVKKEETALVNGTDYIATFSDEGYVLITIIAGGAAELATKLKVAGNQIDPQAVTETDIIGGYDAVSGVETGLELIRQVYPRFGVVPGMIVAPFWSKKKNVGAAMDAKCKEINGVFSCETVLDLDTAQATKYTDVKNAKENAGYEGEHSVVLWPMVKVEKNILSYSAIYAAMVAYTDAENDDVPNLSPSNKLIKVTGIVLEDGTEVVLDETQANVLNGSGIVTALNANGFRSWGNNTAGYPKTTETKDRWICCRRFFSWWGNQFILSYKERVDSPSNVKLIEAIVDSENIRGNSYVAQGKCAGAKIEYIPEENTLENILNGKMVFRQHLAPFTPAEDILNVLEFDPSMIEKALGGGN